MRNIDNAKASKAHIRQHKRLNTHMPMQMKCTHKSHKQQHSVQHNALQQASRMKKSPMGMFTDFASRYCTGGRAGASLALALNKLNLVLTLHLVCVQRAFGCH